MDTDKVIQDLNRRFAVPLPEFYQRRIIFWYDEDKEFEDKTSKSLSSGNVDDDTPSFAISLYKEYRGQGIGSQLMVKMLELLKWHGYERASLAVQKANYAVKMYENVGFKTVEENDEEYIMVCEL